MGIFACVVCGDPFAYNSFSPNGWEHNCLGPPPMPKLQWEDEPMPTLTPLERLQQKANAYSIALEAIAIMPVKEQDNLISVSMRKIASDALKAQREIALKCLVGDTDVIVEWSENAKVSVGRNSER